MKAAAVARDVAARLAETDSIGLNATLDWSAGLLDREAARVDAMPAPMPLHAMPIAVKDNIVTVEQPSTCASKILEGYVSPYNATAIERLRAAGAMVACKANMDEFAMGSSTENSAFGRVKNPIDHSRVPGGSVRQPASFCGIVGIKPSYGRVSRYGLIAFGSSLDCISVFGNDVANAAAVLGVMSGHDPLDATTAREPALPLSPGDLPDLKNLVVGLPREYYPADLDPGVRAGLDRTIAAVRAQGAEIREVSLPHSKYAVPTYYIVAPAEAASNLARFDGVRYGLRRIEDGDDVADMYRRTRGEGFGHEVRRRILVGTYVLSAGYYDAYYGKAQAVRALIAEDFRKVFASGVDLLLTPTTPTPAFKAGEKADDPVAMYYADIFVCAISLAGLPAMSIPVGRSEGLPIGAQIIAPMFHEQRMLAAAQVLERVVSATEEVR